MAKKTKNKINSKKPTTEEIPPEIKNLPKDVQEKLKKIKEKLDTFQSKVLEKFDKYIVGISLLPPPKPKSADEKIDKDKISVLVLVDDSDSKKMSKQELKEKLSAIIFNIAQDIDKNITPQTIILSELWQSCFDGKYDLLQLIALGAPVFDRGMLQAIKITEIHKSMVLKKFERYIVSYVLVGSLPRGQATPTSDIDVWIVVDDTDVKKMTRAELKDKLRAIIMGMAIEAGDITGIKNKLSCQVHILTDVWDSMKEANPVVFTFLRDGVPFFDRGVFTPWKQLLKMGKIKPSKEAIDMYMSSGEQMLSRVKWKIKDIGMEDAFWATMTPSQAALMMYGVPPPTPNETPGVMREILVKKEKLIEDKWVKILEKIVKVRKDLEHGSKKTITGKEVDDLLKDAEAYLNRLKKVFETIEKKKESSSVVDLYDSIVSVVRDVLKIEGILEIDQKDILNVFKDKLVTTGKIPEQHLRTLKELFQAKKDYDSGKLTKAEIEKVKVAAGPFIKHVVEYMQRKRGRELEKTKIKVKYGDKYGEVILLGTEAFIIHDIDESEKKISKAKITEEGGLATIKDSKLEELEKAIASLEIPQRTFIKQKIFEDLTRIFGENVEILVTY